MHDFGFKRGILKEKKRYFCLSGVFLKGKCVIFGLNGGFSKRKWVILQEKLLDFLLNGGFSKRKRMIFGLSGEFPN